MIEVATIGKSVSFHGECKLSISSDFKSQFKKNIIFKDKDNNDFEIEYFYKNRNVIKFKNINDEESIKNLAGTILFTTKEDTRENCDLQKNEFFYFDIIDCLIIENDEILGKVEEIQRIGNTDYFHIQADKTFMIPYIDNYILEMDIENKKIHTKNAKLILENS